MRNQSKKAIILPHGNLIKLASELGVSKPHARMCLKGAYDTALAKLVRKTAVERYNGRYI